MGFGRGAARRKPDAVRAVGPLVRGVQFWPGMLSQSWVIATMAAWAMGQTPSIEASQTSAPAAGLWSNLHGTLLVDTFGSANLEENEATTDRVFDTASRSFGLSYAKVGVWLDAKPVGFRIDVGVGQTTDVLSSDTTIPVLRNFEQAFVSAKLPLLKGITVDFGRYLTCAGNETVDSRESWLYSRSLIFGYAAPFTHTGFRATAQLTDEVSVVLGVNQGWDVIIDNNTSKSVFGSVVFENEAGTEFWVSGFAGRELPAEDAPWRFLLDGVFKQKLPKNFEAALNFDAAVEGPTAWYGAALSGHYTYERFDFAARLEAFNDPQNTRLKLPQAPGGGSWAWEGTLSARATLMPWVQLRAEYRHDQFTGQVSRPQDTITFAVVAGI